MNSLQHKIFCALCEEFSLPEPVAEYRFSPPRRWKFDYCFPEQKVYIEVEGGIWSKGRHVRGIGYLKDLEKYNAAAEMGYRGLRYTPQQLNLLTTITQIRNTVFPVRMGA